jgi:hypothetical protein
VILSFVLLPVIVMQSHGAAAWKEAGEVMAHGHAHVDDGIHSGHGVTDHDHQFQALAITVGDGLPRPPAALVSQSDYRMAGLVRDGPRRPPRQI